MTTCTYKEQEAEAV